MVPAVAARSPESRLMSVVLPAPLGPTRAWRVPRWSSSDTSRAASRPPKRRPSRCVARMASVTLGPSHQRGAEAAPQAGQAPGDEEDQEDHGAAQQELPVGGGRLED